MPAYKIKAPRDLGKICKGFEFIVQSPSTNPSEAIRQYLINNGYTDQPTLSHWSSGNWIVEKLG